MLELPRHPTPEEAVRKPGDWQHSNVAANGARFHIVTQGPRDGPLVLLAHGFPAYWYTWRHLLPRLADAGYLAVAMDLRGYGGSDHTPRGYDTINLAADLRGVVRALGRQHAVIVGQGWGAFIGWTAVALQPDMWRGLVAVSMPHPVRLRSAILKDPEQRRLSRYALGYQLPGRPETRLVADDAAEVGRYLHTWSGPGEWPDPDSELHLRRAFQFRATAHCALEYHRWAMRSIPRPDGIRFIHRMEQPIIAPVLQIHGTSDRTVLARSVDGSEAFVAGPYQRKDLPGIGHFPHEEAPDAFNALVLDWLASGPVANDPTGRHSPAARD